jgi:hypothetical protein
MEWTKSRIDEFVKYVISNDVESLEKMDAKSGPFLSLFPLCGKWRSNITGLHLSAAYGNLTCAEYFIDKISINAQTSDGVFSIFVGHHFTVLQLMAIITLLIILLRKVQIQNFQFFYHL